MGIKRMIITTLGTEYLNCLIKINHHKRRLPLQICMVSFQTIVRWLKANYIKEHFIHLKLHLIKFFFHPFCVLHLNVKHHRADLWVDKLSGYFFMFISGCHLDLAKCKGALSSFTSPMLLWFNVFTHKTWCMGTEHMNTGKDLSWGFEWLHWITTMSFLL